MRMCFHAFSKFGDIFDEDHFIESLRKHVRVVKQLPEDVFLRFGYNISTIPNMRTKAFSPPSYYLQQVLPKMLELGYVFLPCFSSLNKVVSDIWNLGMPQYPVSTYVLFRDTGLCVLPLSQIDWPIQFLQVSKN